MKKMFLIYLILSFLLLSSLPLTAQDKYSFFLLNPEGSEDLAYLDISKNPELLKKAKKNLGTIDPCSLNTTTFKRFFNRFETDTTFQYRNTVFPLTYSSPEKIYIINSKYQKANEKNNLFPNTLQRTRNDAKYEYKIKPLEHGNPVAVVKLKARNNSEVYNYIFHWTAKTCWKLVEIRKLDDYGQDYPAPYPHWLENNLKAFDKRYYVVNREEIRNLPKLASNLIKILKETPLSLNAENDFEIFFNDFAENNQIQYSNVKFPIEYLTLPVPNLKGPHIKYLKFFILENKFGAEKTISEKSNIFPNSFQRNAKKIKLNYFVNPQEEEIKNSNNPLPDEVKRQTVRLFHENEEQCQWETIYHFEYKDCWRLVKIAFPENERKLPIIPKCAEKQYQSLFE